MVCKARAILGNGVGMPVFKVSLQVMLALEDFVAVRASPILVADFLLVLLVREWHVSEVSLCVMFCRYDNGVVFRVRRCLGACERKADNLEMCQSIFPGKRRSLEWCR